MTQKMTTDIDDNLIEETVEDVKKQLTQTTAAYQELTQKYAKLFNLYAQLLDMYLSNK